MAQRLDVEEKIPEPLVKEAPEPYPVPNLALVGVKWKSTLVAFLLVLSAALVALSFADFIFDPEAEVRASNIESAKETLASMEEAGAEAASVPESGRATTPKSGGDAIARSQNALLSGDVADESVTAKAVSYAIPYIGSDAPSLSPWLWVSEDNAHRAWSFDTPIAYGDGKQEVLWTFGDDGGILAWTTATWDPATDTFSGFSVHVTPGGDLISSATPEVLTNRIADENWRASLSATKESASEKALADAVARGEGARR